MLLLVFLYSLLLGSFLNVCIYRIPRHESVVFSGSHCTHCGTLIKYYDLIPVISYFVLGGKCRSCKSSISPRYPLVEFITAALITLQGWKFGITASFILFAALTAVLIIITAVDFDYQLIPDSFILAIAALGLINLIAIKIPQLGASAIIDSAVGFLVGGVLFFLLAVVSKGGMGGGDIKLMAVLGLWFGWKGTLLLTLLSFVGGAAVSIPLLILHRKTGKDGIPFGPFISLSAYLVALFGDEIINWYVQYISAI